METGAAPNPEAAAGVGVRYGAAEGGTAPGGSLGGGHRVGADPGAGKCSQCPRDESWGALPARNQTRLFSPLPFPGETQPGLKSSLCSPQIMIEFCPGGAVDATMLGECRPAPMPTGHFQTPVTTLGQMAARGATAALSLPGFCLFSYPEQKVWQPWASFLSYFNVLL